MLVLAKVGGRVLEDAQCRAAFAASVAAAVAAGHGVVVVHGGGAQLTRLAERLGLGAEERVDGQRVTGPEQLHAALQALAGEVNAELVLALGDAGVRAIGVTGADRADAVLFLSDVPHVRGEGDVALGSIDAGAAARLRAGGVIAGGMIPKVEAGLAAAAAVAARGGVARMGSGLVPDPVGALLAGGGTAFAAAASGVTA